MVKFGGREWLNAGEDFVVLETRTGISCDAKWQAF